MTPETKMKIAAISKAEGITATKRIMRKLVKKHRKRKSNSQIYAGLPELQSFREEQRRESRHLHLVRGMLKCKKYSDIEQSTREGNKPNPLYMSIVAMRFNMSLSVDATSQFIEGV
jgi:hypothetical protein